MPSNLLKHYHWLHWRLGCLLLLRATPEQSPPNNEMQEQTHVAPCLLGMKMDIDQSKKPSDSIPHKNTNVNVEKGGWEFGWVLGIRRFIWKRSRQVVFFFQVPMHTCFPIPDTFLIPSSKNVDVVSLSPSSTDCSRWSRNTS